MKMTHNMLLVCATASMLVGCSSSSESSRNDVKVSYLQQYYPQLLSLRDQMVFQIEECGTNINKLNRLHDSFTQSDSRSMVANKIKDVTAQRDQLKHQLQKIDSTAEQGIALREFNIIDGGGERATELNLLTKESQQRVEGATKLNSNIHKMYNTTAVEQAPTKKASQQHIKISCVAFYPFYFELPPVDYRKLNQVFDSRPELFDIESDAGKQFIHTVRSYQTFNPHFFDNKSWIELVAATVNIKK